MASSQGMTSPKHMFTPESLLVHLSITEHTDYFLNSRTKLCNIQMRRIGLKTKPCVTMMGPTAFFLAPISASGELLFPSAQLRGSVGFSQPRRMKV